VFAELLGRFAGDFERLRTAAEETPENPAEQVSA
jgi:hypothetical protein